MRIKSIKIKSGQSIDLGPFTVLVGPNNVGKSQTLRDINSKISGGRDARSILVNQIVVDKPTTFDDLFRGLLVIDHPTHMNHKLVRGITSNLLSGDEFAFQSPSFEQQFAHSQDGAFLLGGIGKFRVAFLDASSRLLVASTTSAFNPHTSAPQHLLQVLFHAGKKLEDQLREAFKKTFGMDIKLDYSGMTQLYLRVTKLFPPIPDDPREAFPIMKDFSQLDTQGDGFRSFVGVILSLLLSEGRIILLDEPEAFLHPAQARQLGQWIGDFVKKSESQIIVATHNSNFLTGILASNTNVDIFRLNRHDDVTTYHEIKSEAISRLTKSPLLSSQSVLDSVFHKGVVVCEADSDRTIYQTVALREFGNQTTLFIHAQSKQTVKDVVGLLRDATIPVCAIVDIDILNSHEELESLLNALTDSPHHVELLNLRDKIAKEIEGRPDSEIIKNLQAEISNFLNQLQHGEHTLAGARSAIRRIDSTISKWFDIKKRGLDAFGLSRSDAETIIRESKKIGLFIVPVGELESWIDVGTRQKKKWIVLALEQLFDGKCPAPLKDFMREILLFLGDLTLNKEQTNEIAITTSPKIEH
ncbi:MAG: AAA family ATPase [Bacteroidota bacterium]